MHPATNPTTAVVHIGMPKAGSTTIQRFLWRNRSKIADQGFVYHRVTPQHLEQSDYVIAALSRIGRQIDHPRWKSLFKTDDPAACQQRKADIAAAVSAAKGSTWIISGKHLYTKLRDLKAVASLRVQTFEPDTLLDGDLIKDFCAAIGLPNANLARQLTANTSLTAAQATALCAVNRRASFLSRFSYPARALRWGVIRATALLTKPRKLQLCAQQRQTILDIAAPSNEALRARLFPTRATLFSMADLASMPTAKAGAVDGAVAEFCAGVQTPLDRTAR
jgi:hypothetical protein